MKDFSIVIAVYNEINRLPKTLDRLLAYMRSRKETFEILIVNDGSRDGTENFVNEFSKRNQEIRLLSHFPNRGRGSSIREGVLAANGKIILETDADNSVDNEAIGRFLNEFYSDNKLMVMFGSREMKGSVITKKQPFLRVFLGKGFIFVARALFWMWGIHDFTLGFKMFRMEAAQDIFKYQYDNYYTAEAEIVFLSRKRGWKYLEMPVTWTDDKDSRIYPFLDSMRSMLGMLKVLGNYFQGRY